MAWTGRVILPQTGRGYEMQVGALLGALLGFLLGELGIPQLGIPLSAIGFMACSSMAGLAFGAALKTPWLIRFTLPLLAVYGLLAGTPLVGPLTRGWIRNDRIDGRPADAIVVLSSGVTSDTTLHQSGADRLLAGVELVRMGRAPLVVTSRLEGKAADGGVLSSDVDQGRLIRLAGAEGQWLVIRGVRSTREEATGAAELLIPRGIRRIVLVTSPMHTRRACAVFETVGFSVRCVAARERSTPVRNPQSADDRLAAFQQYLYERLATVKYRVSGWIG